VGTDGGAAATPALSVVVPAWNERRHILACVEGILAALAPLDPEVVVVDDGSEDGTGAACAAWIRAHPGARVALVRQPHRGKGAALAAGAAVTRGRAVAFVDADRDIPPEELWRLWWAREAAGLDVVVGAKGPGAARARPLGRRVVSAAFAWAVRRALRLPVPDTQTGIKLFPGPWLREAARRARVRGFLFDVELLARAQADGLAMGWVPVAVRRGRPRSRIGLGDLLRTAWEVPRLVCALRALGRSRRAPSRPRVGDPVRVRP
jgi:dolichyl-phosphate beta-glucosyltransferase